MTNLLRLEKQKLHSRAARAEPPLSQFQQGYQSAIRQINEMNKGTSIQAELNQVSQNNERKMPLSTLPYQAKIPKNKKTQSHKRNHQKSLSNRGTKESAGFVVLSAVLESVGFVLLDMK